MNSPTTVSIEDLHGTALKAITVTDPMDLIDFAAATIRTLSPETPQTRINEIEDTIAAVITTAGLSPATIAFGDPQLAIVWAPAADLMKAA